MTARIASRESETDAIRDFLASAAREPSGLLVEGDAGIGKTTLWLGALRQAEEFGFTILSARPAAAETTLAYACLADLLGGLHADVWETLAPPQRRALDSILFRTDTPDATVDQRVVAAGFLSVIDCLVEKSPVLVAIDDLQWLDSSTVKAVTFAARRLSGHVGLLGTVRTQDGHGIGWLQLPRPDSLRRITLRPLTLGVLAAVVSERLGRTFPRPTMVWIHETSGGNPFYAIELARAELAAESAGGERRLPASVAELVRARIGHLDADARALLLAGACATAPTPALLATATGCDPAQVARILGEVEGRGIIVMEGDRLHFTHPLLAHGVYAAAGPAARRAMHHQLAQLVTQPELRARHLALAATGADDRTLETLDDAAEWARRLGAPAAAAELLDLAVRLGGDTPRRRIGAAGHHFKAGDIERARKLLEEVVASVPRGPTRAEALSLLAVVRLSRDSFAEAAALLEDNLVDAGDDRELRTQMLISLAFALLNLGRLADALRVIEDAVSDAQHGSQARLSQTLSVRVVLRFLLGRGVDEPGLRRALALEDRTADTPLTVRSHVHHAMLLAWTGQLDNAHEAMLEIRQRCLDHGDESELMFVAFHGALIEIWRGNFADAELIAEDTMERALQLDADVPMCQALSMRASLAAFAGRVDDARRDARAALEVGIRCGSPILMAWPITTLGFVDVSLADHRSALATLKPLLEALDATPEMTEIVLGWCLPDAIEAMVAVGRDTDAEVLIERMERNGRRLRRRWMLGVAARGRGALLAGRGDLDSALGAAEYALTEFSGLSMPFEYARAQLLLGRVKRRHGHQTEAAITLQAALQGFDDLGVSLWSHRTRAEMGRTNVGPRSAARLTRSEWRVAELAARGRTNREVASELFISPKTVEANLGRVYRKLDIHSRAELGRCMAAYDA